MIFIFKKTAHGSKKHLFIHLLVIIKINLKKIISFNYRIATRVQRSLVRSLQALELRQTRPVPSLPAAQRARFRHKRLHLFVERRQTHFEARQVSQTDNSPAGARRCLRFARYASAIHRVLLEGAQLLDKLILAGCTRRPGRARPHRRKDIHIQEAAGEGGARNEFE